MKHKRLQKRPIYFSVLSIIIIIVAGAIFAKKTYIPTPGVAPAVSGKNPHDTVYQFYTWYVSCEEKHGAHGNTYASTNSCIYTQTPLVAITFIRNLPKDTIDPFFCEEGLPASMQFYTAQVVNPTKVVMDVYVKQNGAVFGFPVTVEKNKEGWQITSIACDLDGHID